MNSSPHGSVSARPPELQPLVLPLPKPKPRNRRGFNFDRTSFSAPLLGRFSCEHAPLHRLACTEELPQQGSPLLTPSVRCSLRFTSLPLSLLVFEMW
ncbi:hypothetical protein SRHO_G00073540 [Serrasalmus rhombeus]